MNWQEVCAHPALKDLPFKIELNERGQIVMSPAKVYHAAFQGKIARLFPDTGHVLTECAVKTRKGTKVADVAWCSAERFRQIREETECSISPEICVEILSTGNTGDEMAEKRSLYFEAGAEEVWFCEASGAVRFFRPGGAMSGSERFPSFPECVAL